MAYYRQINSVVEALIRAKREGIRVNLLIGAGCSVTAGIPMADGMIDEIKKEYSAETEHLYVKTYSNYMAKLTPIERRKLINKYVKDSKINWAHIGMAHLMNNDYIHRVLTTNFDNIFLRACSLVGEFPGIYDMTTYGGEFRSDLLSEKSILYLHGQHTSFVLCNTDKEVEEQREKLRDTFDELKRNSMWIILGYSCTNDAIWQLLSSEKSFENRLYLIGYENNSENDNMKKILSEDKYAFYIKGYNADSFFIELMKALDIFPPKIINKPFSYLSDTISSIAEYKDDDSFLSNKLNGTTLEILDDAIKNYEDDDIRMCKYYFQLGLFEKFNDRIKKIDENKLDEIVEFINEYNYKTREVVKEFIIDNKDSIGVNGNITLKLREATEIISIDRQRISQESIELLKGIDEIYRKFEIDTLEYDDVINWVRCIIITIEFDESSNKLEELKRAENIYKSKVSNKKEDKVILNELSRLYLKMAKFDEENVDEYIQNLLQTIEEAHRRDCKDIKVLIDWGTYLLSIIQFVEDDWEDMYYKAKEKFNEAVQLVDNNEAYKIMSIYSNRLFDIFLEYDNEVIKDKCITDSMDIYSAIYLENQLCNISNNDWERMIITILKRYKREKYISLIENYFSIVKRVIGKHKCNKKLSTFIGNVNNVSYSLIKNNELEIAEEIIEFCLQIDKKNSFVNATKGLLYFKNNKLSKEIREKNGECYYKKAIELSGSDTDLSLAFKQKYYFEYGVFLCEVKEDNENGVKYLKLAKEFGRIEPYISNYMEIMNYILKYKIEIKDIDYANEAAVEEVRVEE